MQKRRWLIFLAPPLVMYVTQNQRCLTKNLKQRCLKFLVEHLCCVHKFKGRRCSTQNLEHLLRFLKMCTLSIECIFSSQHKMYLEYYLSSSHYSTSFQWKFRHNFSNISSIMRKQIAILMEDNAGVSKIQNKKYWTDFPPLYWTYLSVTSAVQACCRSLWRH